MCEKECDEMSSYGEEDEDNSSGTNDIMCE